MCNVRNNVSKEETVIHLTSCQGSVLHGIIIIIIYFFKTQQTVFSYLYVCVF